MPQGTGHATPGLPPAQALRPQFSACGRAGMRSRHSRPPPTTATTGACPGRLHPPPTAGRPCQTCPQQPPGRVYVEPRCRRPTSTALFLQQTNGHAPRALTAAAVRRPQLSPIEPAGIRSRHSRPPPTTATTGACPGRLHPPPTAGRPCQTCPQQPPGRVYVEPRCRRPTSTDLFLQQTNGHAPRALTAAAVRRPQLSPIEPAGIRSRHSRPPPTTATTGACPGRLHPPPTAGRPCQTCPQQPPGRVYVEPRCRRPTSTD